MRQLDKLTHFNHFHYDVTEIYVFINCFFYAFYLNLEVVVFSFKNIDSPQITRFILSFFSVISKTMTHSKCPKYGIFFTRATYQIQFLLLSNFIFIVIPNKYAPFFHTLKLFCKKIQTFLYKYLCMNQVLSNICIDHFNLKKSLFFCD